MLSGGFRHATPAVAALALGLTTGESAIAQRPATGRVTITSQSPAEPLRPPRKTAVGPMIMAKSAFEVQNWFDRTAAPANLPPAPRAIVLARELKVENVHYTIDTPRLVIVVDKLRIGANGVIDSSGRQVRAPGGRSSSSRGS
jgi:hypothetical protein